jgi:hypothetical protein
MNCLTRVSSRHNWRASQKTLADVNSRIRAKLVNAFLKVRMTLELAPRGVSSPGQ